MARTKVIGPQDSFRPSEELQPDDAYVSLFDLASAGRGIGVHPNDAVMLGSNLVSLSSLISRIVLSRRLVITMSNTSRLVDSEPINASLEPADYFVRELTSRCDTLIVDEDHPIPSAIILQPRKDVESTLGPELTSALTSATRSFLPTYTPGSENVWLREQLIAIAYGAPLASNPFFSAALGVSELRVRGAADVLIRYVEDLRKDVCAEHNILRGVSIFDLQIPALFSAVLQECNSPQDLIRVAVQMSKEAEAFRSWCRSLDDERDPRKYNDRMASAQETLTRLAGAIGSRERERLQVPVSVSVMGVGTEVVSRSLSRLLDLLDVDMRFLRPRRFLLNLSSVCRQIKRMDTEISRVFRIDKALASAASHHLLMRAEADGPSV